MFASRKYIIALVALAVLISAGLLLFYAPRHWLSRMSDARVSVDGRALRADVYMGQPTNNEADAYALVLVPGVGNYILDFNDETYREPSNYEFIRLPRGAWTFRSMLTGQFKALLPFRHLNEFRFTSPDGRVVTVAF
jgi:hypothetical protein